MWNKDYRHMWRIPSYWRAAFIKTSRPDIFTTDYLQKLDARDDSQIKNLFVMEVGLDQKDALPSILLNKDICAKVLHERATNIGSRLANIPAAQFAPSGVLDWHLLGQYTITFDDDSKFSEIRHRSGSVAVVPSVIVLTRDFMLVDNYSDMAANIVCRLDTTIEHRLCTVFAKETGPHAHSIGAKGAEFKLFSGQVAQRLRLEQLRTAASKVVEEPELLSAGKIENKKRCLEKARERVKAVKARKVEASRCAV